jgi:two-component system OmpR family sensor kinase
VTLRARLLVGLLVLAAAGLAVAGVVTYQEQKGFLLDRVDAQLRSAIQAPQQLRADLENSDANSARQLPVGTYAEIHWTDGGVVPLGPDLADLAHPKIPTKVALNTAFTVRSPHYRVLAGTVRVRTGELSGSFVTATLVVAIPMRDVDDTLHRLFLVELFVAFGVLLTLALLTWFVVKLGLKPLRQMEATAGAIAAGDLSRRVEVVDPNTEVGRLGIALNEMLHQIEHAFAERSQSEERLRRFVADASHELRTPLTSIRGYAELFRRGAADRPEDLAKTMRRIEEEAARMGVLVDDLLLLARLDQGRPLEREPVDLTRITADAVDDARAIAPDRPIEYSPNGAVVVPGDEARLRQVLANLLQNANRHTPPDTHVYVSVATDDTDAVIEVRDEGPGMEPEDAARVFERFWRIDPSRARMSGGAGLGLAIVSAIADAHGGRAEVDTEPGQGAAFRVYLPLTAPDPEPEPDPVAEFVPVADEPAPPHDRPRVPEIPLADLDELEDVEP